MREYGTQRSAQQSAQGPTEQPAQQSAQRPQRGRRHAVQAATAITAAAIGVAVIAGCASRGSGLAARSDKSAGGAIQFAAAQMETAKSVHVHAVLSGAADADAGTGTETGTIDGSVILAPTLKGDVTLKLDAKAPMVPTRIIYDGKYAYTTLPEGYHATAKNKPKAAWFAVDTGNPSATDSSFFKELKEDPAALVKAALAKGKFTQAGSDSADGIAATHFTGDVTGKPAGHVEVWLDDAGLPVKLVFQSTASGGKDRAEIHFSDWGKPVTIAAPPAEEVLTAEDEAVFAIPGQEFKISSTPSPGIVISTEGLPGFDITASIGSSSGSAQTLCLQMPNHQTQASPSGQCVTVTWSSATPSHR